MLSPASLLLLLLLLLVHCYNCYPNCFLIICDTHCFEIILLHSQLLTINDIVIGRISGLRDNNNFQSLMKPKIGERVFEENSIEEHSADYERSMSGILSGVEIDSNASFNYGEVSPYRENSEHSLHNREVRPKHKRRGSTERRSFQEMQLLKGSFSDNNMKVGSKSPYHHTPGRSVSPATRNPKVQDPKINESFYFGESAKIAFFTKFRQLTVALASSTVVKAPHLPGGY